MINCHATMVILFGIKKEKKKKKKGRQKSGALPKGEGW
jgi:hypothetical protein